MRRIVLKRVTSIVVLHHLNGGMSRRVDNGDKVFLVI